MKLYERTDKLLEDVLLLNKTLDKECLSSPLFRDVLLSNYESYDKSFAHSMNLNGSEYFSSARDKEGKLFDPKLFTLTYLVGIGKLDKIFTGDILEKFGGLSDDEFNSLGGYLALDDRYIFSLEELKKGLEEGLNINEVLGCLGFSKADSRENIRFMLTYLDFFRSKGLAKPHEAASFVRALRRPGKAVDPQLVLRTKEPSELEISAPVIETTQEAHEAYIAGKKKTGSAHYFAYAKEGDPDNMVYRCFSPDDGEMITTESQFNAQSWVMNKNNGFRTGRRKTSIQNRKAR